MSVLHEPGAQADYAAFLAAKAALAPSGGLECEPGEVNPLLKPHQRDAVVWAVRGGRRALFERFGLGKTVQQLEIVRLVLAKSQGTRGLIVCPLGVKQEFVRDARLLARGESDQITDDQRAELRAWQRATPWSVAPIPRFVRSNEEATEPGVYLTNYESVREGKLDPTGFDVVSLDEAGILRGFGGTKTFRELMRLYEGTANFRFVATATPSPNEYIELLAYAAFLDVMDVGQAKTRFFHRDSTKADHLTLHPHKEREFWLWVASWALFVQKPSDLGYSDDGYELPELDVRWHELPSSGAADFDKHGRGRMFPDASLGVVEASRERRESLAPRIERMIEILDESPTDHFLVWHDLEAERGAIEAALPDVVTVWGTQDLEERERRIIGFSDGDYRILATKAVIAGSGCNFQRYCHRAIFLGIGFKFNDFIQAVHRIHRFLQTEPVRIDLIYTEAEREIRKTLERKWRQHDEQVARMGDIIREFGLAHEAMAAVMRRSIGVERQEATGEHYQLVNADSVEETARMADASVDLIITSIPFATQYEYTPSYNDFGHTEDNAHFWEQMDYLTPELLRVLQPGRLAGVHVKDRIVPGGMTGLGFQTVQPFHAEAIAHYTRHGFAFLGMKTIVTDVVRENNQTYRLGWTEQCKDGTKMGYGLPEYLLLFRRPPTDRSNGYADLPVVKSKADYTRSRWQIDAHGFARSSGNRLLTPEDLEGLTHRAIFRLFRERSLEAVYDHESHVALSESLEQARRLPTTFMLLQPPSWHPDVWTDVARMRTLNMRQKARGEDMHLCLARGSLVLTRERGYVPIETVEAGEHALTHRGRWRPILAVQQTGRRDAVSIFAQGVAGLTLTPDHKIWAKKVRATPWAKAHSRKEATCVAPDWIEANDTVGSYVAQILPPEEEDGHEPRFWWTIGRWIADGHITTRGGAVISVGPQKMAEFEAMVGVADWGRSHAGTASQYLLRDADHSLRDVIARCGRGAAGKHLPPEAFTLPTPAARALLDGYLSGDGHLVPGRMRWMATSVSRPLLMGLSMLVLRAYGSVASLYQARMGGKATIQGRVVDTRQEWVLSFDLPSRERRNGMPFASEGYSWKKVRKLTSAGEVETWNIRVEEDESYTAEGTVVKNCPLQFDIVNRLIVSYSNPGETVFDPFAGVGTVPYCAVLKGRRGLGIELSPTYYRDAVFYAEEAERKASAPTLFDLLEAETDETQEPEEAAL
jgi:hypothetical protein